MSKNKKLLILIVVIFIITAYSINFYSDKRNCLQMVNYKNNSNVYLLEDEDGHYTRGISGKTAVFKTKNEALEYCLSFIY